ncbi:hypothetical protein CORC01_08052, partial [Colletotrichum orchidophilum]
QLLRVCDSSHSRFSTLTRPKPPPLPVLRSSNLSFGPVAPVNNTPASELASHPRASLSLLPKSFLSSNITRLPLVTFISRYRHPISARRIPPHQRRLPKCLPHNKASLTEITHCLVAEGPIWAFLAVTSSLMGARNKGSSRRIVIVRFKLLGSYELK